MRFPPNLPASAVKTYAISSPLATHFRPGSCAEANCAAHRLGWTTSVDEATELGRRQAHYIRSESGRKFTPTRTEAGLTVFTFEAGQKCFQQHQIPLDRPEVYTVRDGDWRGNPRGTETRVHPRAETWVEEFAENQDRLATAMERG